MALPRRRTIAAIALFCAVTTLVGCAAPSPQGQATGEYAPVPDLVTSEEVTFRESFEMSPEDTHEYWSDPTIFSNADTFNYTSPDGAIGEQSADRPTGAYIEPTDGMAIGENGNGLGDVEVAEEFQPADLAKSATGRLYIAFGDQFNFVCSGTVVNSASGSVVATAAHCLVDTETGELAKNALFVPDDLDNGKQQPHGAWSAVDMVVPQSFIDGVEKSNTTIDGDGWTYDFGFLVMEEQDGQTLQETTGAMGIAFGVPTRTLISTGYPAAGDFDGSKRFFCSTTSFEHGRFGGYYWPCNMTPGMSGGGVFAYYDQDRSSGYLVAVNSLVYFEQGDQDTVHHTESAVLGEQAQQLYIEAGGWGS